MKPLLSPLSYAAIAVYFLGPMTALSKTLSADATTDEHHCDLGAFGKNSGGTYQ
jgi:hypothetical protein